MVSGMGAGIHGRKEVSRHFGRYFIFKNEVSALLFLAYFH